MVSDETRFRRLHRVITTLGGVMSQSFLGTGRPLEEVRILVEIGRGRTDFNDICDYLRLDHETVGRTFLVLEDQGLIITRICARNARGRVAQLTDLGRKGICRL